MASKVGELRHAESDRLGSARECLVELGDLVLGAGQADLQSFDFAQPSFTFGLDNSGLEVVSDLNQAVALCRVRPKKAASHAPLTELTAEFGQVLTLRGEGADSLPA